MLKAPGAERAASPAEGGAASATAAQQQTPSAEGTDLATVRTGDHSESQSRLQVLHSDTFFLLLIMIAIMIVIISPNVLSTQSFYTILNNIDGSGINHFKNITVYVLHFHNVVVQKCTFKRHFVI